MENYGSNESKDSKLTSTESKSGGTAKPNTASAKSLAELLIQKDAHDRQQTIWEREDKAKSPKNPDSPTTTERLSFIPGIKPQLSKESAGKSSESISTELPSTVQLTPEAPATSLTAEKADIPLTGEDIALAQLAPDEARAITEQYVNSRTAELTSEESESPADSPEHAAAAADASLMQKIADKLRAQPEADPRIAVNEAADEVIAEQQLALPVEDAPRDEAPSSVGAINPNLPPAPQANGGGNRPPAPPRYPNGPGGLGFNAYPNPNPNLPNNNPNNQALASSFNTGQPGWGSHNITPIEAQYYARQAENRGLLLGGIVGYLVGRRRGRIKAEKRLEPIQKKLEQEVTTLHDTIASREQQVRSLAAEKVRTTQEAATPRRTPKSEAVEKSKLRPLEAATVIEAPHPVTPAEQVLQPELVPVPILVPVAERQRFGTTLPELSPEKHVERMNKEELLRAAETVIIEGADLRQIYDGKRITERGLRHIMTEYLRGGDVKKALNQELKNRELDYERDPQLRDHLSASSGSSDGTSSGTTSGQSKQRAADGSNDDSIPTSTSKGAETKSKNASSKPNSAPNNMLQGTLIRAWVVLIVVLVIIVFILLVR